jgi:hypothetical protein
LVAKPANVDLRAKRITTTATSVAAQMAVTTSNRDEVALLLTAVESCARRSEALADNVAAMEWSLVLTNHSGCEAC